MRISSRQAFPPNPLSPPPTHRPEAGPVDADNRLSGGNEGDLAPHWQRLQRHIRRQRPALAHKLGFNISEREKQKQLIWIEVWEIARISILQNDTKSRGKSWKHECTGPPPGRVWMRRFPAGSRVGSYRESHFVVRGFILHLICSLHVDNSNGNASFVSLVTQEFQTGCAGVVLICDTLCEIFILLRSSNSEITEGHGKNMHLAAQTFTPYNRNKFNPNIWTCNP